ncbi:MAG: hypothetical protein IJ870_05200 [Alphaproteobacteria bacterium]|nr:hypothetical protein [Alphaproteobacteria bacterium]
MKAQGAAKREARRAKRVANLPKVIEPDLVPQGLKAKVKDLGVYLERLYMRGEKPSSEKCEEIRKLFLLETSRDIRYKAYKRFFHEYEMLIFYAWGFEELHEAAYTFFNEALVPSDAPFSGNSIVRILGYRPKEHLFDILSHHKDKFFCEKCFGSIIETVILRYLDQPGPWNYRTNEYGVWSQKEHEILERIKLLFEN